MRSFAELSGTDLHWEFDTSPVIPVTGDRHYVLFSGSEAAVTAQAKWEKLVSFEVALEAGEGTYFAHLDLAASPLQGVVWKAGSSTSAAGFTLTEWSSSAFAGVITTAGGRTLHWRPKQVLGLPGAEGQLVGPDGSVLMSVAPKNGSTTTGEMSISPALAADPDRAALITLGFALCNEQALFLHQAPGMSTPSREGRLSFRLHAPRRGEVVGPVGAVATGNLGILVLALLVGSLVLEFFSTTLWTIDVVLLTIVVLGLALWSRPRSARGSAQAGWSKLGRGRYRTPDGSVVEGPLAALLAARAARKTKDSPPERPA